MTGSGEYPHLAPELRALAGDALRLWGDADERQRALEDILRAWEAGSPDLERLVARVDDAVAMGLGAIGLPRGPIRAVRIEQAGSRWFGRKHPDCTLFVAGDGLRFMIHVRAQPDSMWRTWVHESIHARQAYSPRAGDEYRLTPGYEEGLVEGLTQITTRDHAGIAIVAGRFDYYVQAYRTLIRALELEVNDVWRALWQYPAGEVRAALLTTVERIRRGSGGPDLTASHRRRLTAIADQLFGVARARGEPDERAMMALWEVALR
jgi:hypothetical protein